MKPINLARTLFFLILTVLAGCSSGGTNGIDDSSATGVADLNLRVDFGPGARTLNQGQNLTVSSITLGIRNPGTGQSVLPSITLSRPATGTVASATFRNVPLGPQLVNADFFNSEGQLLGSDFEIVNLSPGTPILVVLSFLEATAPEPEPDPPPLVTREFVVAANIEELLVFELDEVTGVLTEVFNQNFGPNSLPFSVDIRDDGAVYVTFNLLSSVQQFQLNPTNGSLVSQTVLNRPVPEGGALSTDGRFFFHCQPLLSNPGAIRVYSLDPNTGEPTEIPSSPFIIPGSNRPQRLFAHPNGRFLYAAEFDSAMTNGVFYAFEINSATGALTQIGGAVAVSSPRAFAFEVSPDENTLYVTGNSSVIDGFTINQVDGTLTPVAPSFPLGNDPFLAEMVVDPVRNILYVCGTSIGQIEAYNLDASGRPTTPLAGSPYAIADIGTLTLHRDPSGNFLLATNTGTTTGSVAVFRIESDGTLTTVSGSPFSAGVGTFDFDVVELIVP